MSLRCKFPACRAGPLPKRLQIWGKRADQILVHFCLHCRCGGIWSIFVVFSTHKLIGLGPPLQYPACRAGPLLKGLQIWGKQADQSFGPFLPPGPRCDNLIQIFSLFNTQTSRPLASSATFQHVGQALYSRGFKFWETWLINILVHFCLQGCCGVI